MTWLERLLSQHSELESPQSFWFWSALASISAVVKDNVWIDRQIYNLYPNIYVMLHADSGLKKGPPISMAKQLVRMTGATRIISGRSSIQGILKELGTAQTQPGGKPILKSVAFICSSELTSSLVEDKVATDILTDLYDRQYNMGEWKSLLKMESFSLKDPTITMLTATNEAHSVDFFGKKDAHGGYFARTFIVNEHKQHRINSLLTPLTNPPNYAELAEYLKVLSKLQGPFQAFTSKEQSDDYPIALNGHYYNQAGIEYQRWYEEFIRDIHTYEVKDNTGTLNRFGDSVLKIAMLLSLAKKPELTIDTESMLRAIDEARQLIGSVNELMHGRTGHSESHPVKDMIIKELLSRDTHQISRDFLLKKMWMHYKSASELDDVMQAFDQAGQIVTKSIGNKIIYEMPEHIVQELRRFFAGRMK